MLGPGSTFNDVAVFDGGPNSDSAVAVERTTVGFIPKGAVMRLVDSHPEVAKAALRLLSSRQHALGLVVEDLALRDVTARIARLLLAGAGRHGHILDHAHHACARIRIRRSPLWSARFARWHSVRSSCWSGKAPLP